MANFIEGLNLKKKCKKYGLPLWQCPDFLFLILGIIIIFIILTTFAVLLNKIEDVRTVLLIILFLSAFLMIIDYIIIKSFERMADTTRLQLDFIHIISHQLKTPITNIAFILDFLSSEKEKITPQTEKEYLTMLKENNERMKTLVKNILTVAKIEAGVLEIKKEKVDLKEIVKERLKDYQLFSQSLNINIEAEIPEKEIKVEADPFWLKEVINNLLDNALKFSRGKVKVSLSENDKKIIFEVKDDGPGIPKDEQKYIFQKFFQVKDGSSHALTGSGLGLYLSKKLINLMGGEIGFSSYYQKGSNFWFSFPKI